MHKLTALRILINTLTHRIRTIRQSIDIHIVSRIQVQQISAILVRGAQISGARQFVIYITRYKSIFCSVQCFLIGGRCGRQILALGDSSYVNVACGRNFQRISGIPLVSPYKCAS